MQTLQLTPVNLAAGRPLFYKLARRRLDIILVRSQGLSGVEYIPRKRRV
jgi:hypothetical protein